MLQDWDTCPLSMSSFPATTPMLKDRIKPASSRGLSNQVYAQCRTPASTNPECAGKSLTDSFEVPSSVVEEEELSLRGNICVCPTASKSPRTEPPSYCPQAYLPPAMDSSATLGLPSCNEDWSQDDQSENYRVEQQVEEDSMRDFPALAKWLALQDANRSLTVDRAAAVTTFTSLTQQAIYPNQQRRRHRMTPQLARQKAAELAYEIGALQKVQERLERKRDKLLQIAMGTC